MAVFKLQTGLASFADGRGKSLRSGRARTAGAMVRRRRRSAGSALAPGPEDRHQLRFDGQQRPDDVVEERCRELLRGGGVAFQ